MSNKTDNTPVYVTDTNPNELIFNPGLMEKGRRYHVTWDGEEIVLVKDDKYVSIYTPEDDTPDDIV